jgi:hypothetical protein
VQAFPRRGIFSLEIFLFGVELNRSLKAAEKIPPIAVKCQGTR